MAKIETKPADAEELVKDRLKELISFREENQDIKDFWGKQFDLGLAWVHFPEGSGGLNVNPKFQLLVNETLRNEGIYLVLGWALQQLRNMELRSKLINI